MIENLFLTIWLGYKKLLIQTWLCAKKKSKYLLQTLNRSWFRGKLFVKLKMPPLFANLSPFLFAAQIAGFDLNSLPNYFDEDADAPLYCTQVPPIGLPTLIEVWASHQTWLMAWSPVPFFKFWVWKFMLLYPPYLMQQELNLSPLLLQHMVLWQLCLAGWALCKLDMTLKCGPTRKNLLMAWSLTR